MGVARACSTSSPLSSASLPPALPPPQGCGLPGVGVLPWGQWFLSVFRLPPPSSFQPKP